MKKRNSSGSALLLVLWAIIVVSIAVTGLVTVIQSDQDESGAIQHAFLARQIAESQVALASHPYIFPDDPSLAENTTLGGRCVTAVHEEGARLDINHVLEKKRPEILSQLFANWGLDPGQVSDLVESLRRWTQPEGLEPMSHDETAYYEEKFGASNAVPHRPFQTVEEMSMVRGMDALIAKKPDWQDYFTVWTDSGINLNSAPPDLIAAVLGDQRAQISALIQQRESMRTSPDEDDRVWTDIKIPLQILGVAADSRAASFFTVQNSVWRIEAVATVGTRNCLVGAVVSKDSVPSKTLYHYER